MNSTTFKTPKTNFMAEYNWANDYNNFEAIYDYYSSISILYSKLSRIEAEKTPNNLTVSEELFNKSIEYRDKKVIDLQFTTEQAAKDYINDLSKLYKELNTKLAVETSN